MKRGFVFDGEDEYERMLSAIAYDLSLPLLQIKASAELKQNSKKPSPDIGVLTQSGLRLIDSYIMALELRSNRQQLVLEPISINSLLADTAHDLQSYAKHYNTTINVEVLGRMKPILTNRSKLQSALYCLGCSLIRAQASSDAKKHTVVLGAQRGRSDSITAGVFGSFSGLSDKAMFRARSLAGQASQPLPSVPAQNAGGILIADMLVSALYQPLKAARFKEYSGLATTFPVSKQLRLV